MADMLSGILGGGQKKPPPQGAPAPEPPVQPPSLYQYNPAIAQAAIRQAFGLQAGG